MNHNFNLNLFYYQFMCSFHLIQLVVFCFFVFSGLFLVSLLMAKNKSHYYLLITKDQFLRALTANTVALSLQ